MAIVSQGIGWRRLLEHLFLVLPFCGCATSAWAQTPTETTEYYGLDALGSVRVVFDVSGNVLARLDYGPFGRELSSSANAPEVRGSIPGSRGRT